MSDNLDKALEAIDRGLLEHPGQRTTEPDVDDSGGIAVAWARNIGRLDMPHADHVHVRLLSADELDDLERAGAATELPDDEREHVYVRLQTDQERSEEIVAETTGYYESDADVRWSRSVNYGLHQYVDVTFDEEAIADACANFQAAMQRALQQLQAFVEQRRETRDE